VIFVTVGTQLPFDRLVKAVDSWAGGTGAAPAFAQIGETDYRPAHMEWVEYLPVMQFRARLAAASVIVSHAGIGSLLTALQARKPMIVMPRLAALQECRNEHQIATAKWLRQLAGITVVEDENALGDALRRGGWRKPDAVRSEASPELLATIREFIEKD
jgi:UDP-N-acetylglucosamine transferase subunit ALG13